MRRADSLLLAAVAALLLSGCASPPRDPAVSGGVQAEDLEAGAFYEFTHRGGALSFGMDAGGGQADLVLFGADDQRIGRITLDDSRSAGRFVVDDLGAGDLVLQVADVNGTLEIRSDGKPVRAFGGLPTHAERHVLLQRPRGLLTQAGVGILGPLDGSPADEALEIILLRAPASLHVLVHAAYSQLAVRLEGEGGTVLTAEDAGAPFQLTPPGFGFGEMPSDLRLENIRDGRFEARITADSFEGVLLLEAVSFSRAQPQGLEAQPTDDEPRFTYGVLPDQPVSFDVRAGTGQLYLLQESAQADACREAATAGQGNGTDEATEDCEGLAARVALFGPRDERVAVVHVPFNRTVAVPVTASGSWVAVLLEGEATLGADRVPADFELHPLDIVVGEFPAQAAGSGGDYGQGREDVDPPGIAFRATPRADFGPTLSGLVSTQCGPSSLSLLQDGETLGAWGYASFGSIDAVDEMLGDALAIEHDGFGAQCPRTRLVTEGYQR